MNLLPVGSLCAVYGSLRAGLGNHRVIENAPRLSDGVISNQFRMVGLGGFPGLLKAGNDSTSIVVEVYEVNSVPQANSLDSLEGYPNFYNREIVLLDDGRECWVYFLEDSRYQSSKPVDSGDWYLECRGEVRTPYIPSE